MPVWFSRAAHDIEAIYGRQVGTVYKVCYSYMRNAPDTEDAVQSVFLKAMDAKQHFQNETHEHAWFIRAAVNHCKDALKSAARKNVSLEEAPEPEAAPHGHDFALDAVLALPPKYKDVVYLYYYEGYATGEIARMLNRNESTVRSHLSEARNILRETLGGDLS